MRRSVEQLGTCGRGCMSIDAGLSRYNADDWVSRFRQDGGSYDGHAVSKRRARVKTSHIYSWKSLGLLSYID